MNNLIFQVPLEVISCLVINAEAIVDPNDEKTLQQQRWISSSCINISRYMKYVTYKYNILHIIKILTYITVPIKRIM